MNQEGRIDIARLIRLATVLFAVAAGFGVYLTFSPQIDAMQQRVDDNNSELRSDEVALSNAVPLHVERATLSKRYAALVAQNPQAVFVRELATTVHRNGVSLVTTSITPEPADTERAPGALFSKTHLSVSLRGTYRRLLATIGDLSMGSEIVEVLAPNLTREGTGTIAATVPLNIYEPLHTLQTQTNQGEIR